MDTRPYTCEAALEREDGFTLIELLVVISLLAILMGLTASALRNYWLTQQLEGASDSLVSQLRQAQQRTDSESAPLVYGVRFQEGTPNWAVVQYDPQSPATTDDDVCNQLSTYAFPDSVAIEVADFNAPTNVLLSKCPEPSLDFVMFYARGTATDGSVTLTSTTTGKSRTVSVLPLTGRVRVTAS